MRKDFKTIILEILEIIEYEEDKNKFADDLIDLGLRQATVNLSNSLPKEKQQEFKNKITDSKDKRLEDIVLEYYSVDNFRSEIQKTTESIIFDFIKSVLSTLNENQRNNLDNHLKSL